jgi:hypothetical protein
MTTLRKLPIIAPKIASTMIHTQPEMSVVAVRMARKESGMQYRKYNKQKTAEAVFL